MKRLIFVSSAILIGAAAQFAHAQPPAGGGFGGGMTFDAINQADEDGNKDDHLTVDELRAFFEQRMAAFGGRGGGGGGGGRGPGAGGPGGGPGGGDFLANMFGSWDANDDGIVTEAEFDERPRGGFGGGRGPGGPPPQ